MVWRHLTLVRLDCRQRLRDRLQLGSGTPSVASAPGLRASLERCGLAGDFHFMKSRCLVLWSAGALVVLSPARLTAAAAEAITLTRSEDRVRVEVAGKLFTEYRFKGGPKPYFSPVLAPDGTELTIDGDKSHSHHHSLYFAHGAVSGVNFWGDSGKDFGPTVSERVETSVAGGVAEIKARDRGLAPDGRLVVIHDTVVRIHATADSRTMDFEITLRAPPDTPVVFGDTKEGTMSIRLGPWMTPTRSVGKNVVAGVGTIVNAAGARNDDTWGKRSPWVDYHAPKGGQTYGVAMFDHPSNPRHPTWWHVRSYGLFAANPFGRHDFEALKDQPNAGDFTIPAGGSATFRWRIYFHYGDERAAKIAERYRDYAGQAR